MVLIYMRETGVNAVLEVRGPEHAELLIDTVRNAGYEINPL